MAMDTDWILYGANGFTGRLIAREAKRKSLRPILAGRRAAPIEALGAQLDLPRRSFDIDDPSAAAAALSDVDVLLNCAGPFAATSGPMLDACLASRTHYLDITGEIDVFVAAHSRHAQAQAAGVVVCPGVGFDVVPTDCVAAVLKQALPDAKSLALGFDVNPPAASSTAILRSSPHSPARQARGRRMPPMRCCGSIVRCATRSSTTLMSTGPTPTCFGRARCWRQSADFASARHVCSRLARACSACRAGSASPM